MEKNNSSIKSRILQHIELQKISKRKFYLKTGISNGILDKPSGLSEDTIEKYISSYPEISPEWLLTGKGEMKRISQSQFPAEHPEGGHFIPMFDTAMATAGSMTTADLSSVIEPSEMVNAGDWFKDATAAMRVHGDSMHPEYSSGSIVAIKEVLNKRLVIYGVDYVIETSEYRVIKRLQRSKELGCWLAYSLNNEVWQNGPSAGELVHEPFDILLDDVARLFIVLGSVKRNHSSMVVSNHIT